MKKLVIAICIALSTSAVLAQHGRHEPQRRLHQSSISDRDLLVGALVIGAIGAAVAVNRSNPEPVYRQEVPPPVPVYRHPERRSPTYDPVTRLYRYVPVPIYDYERGFWVEYEAFYIPAEKHYPGCSFYNEREAWDCIRWHERRR